MAEQQVANPQGATEDEAAARILAVLEDQEKNPEKPVQESLKREPEADEEGEETASEEKEEEEKEAAQPDTEAVEIDPEEPLFEVKVQGQAKKISLNEALKGYMMESDYRQKTAEVARQRDEVQEKIRQGIEGERKQYQEALQMQQALVWNLVAPELQKVDLEKLAEEDPAEYIKVQNRINRYQQVVQRIQAEQQKFVQQEQDRLQKEVLPKAVETLAREIPNWGPELQKTLRATAMEKYGFASEELENIIDPRVIRVLHDAHQFHSSRKDTDKQKEIASKKVILKPKVVKPGPKQDKAQDPGAMDRLKKTGKLDDMAAAIFQRL